MLENLDKVNWANMHHAYGSAEDVPESIRNLASEIEEVRANAYDELCGNIWHQGTVYEATAHAVPFLIELLEQESVHHKDQILVLLSQLATGSSYHHVHQPSGSEKPKVDTADHKAKIGKELSWVRAATDAVKAGHKTYLGLLSHADDSVRDGTAYLFAALGGPAPVLVSELWRRYEVEKEERVKASFLLAL